MLTALATVFLGLFLYFAIRVKRRSINMVYSVFGFLSGLMSIFNFITGLMLGAALLNFYRAIKTENDKQNIDKRVFKSFFGFVVLNTIGFVYLIVV